MDESNAYQEKGGVDPVDYKTLILAQLEKLGSGGPYLWFVEPLESSLSNFKTFNHSQDHLLPLFDAEHPKRLPCIILRIFGRYAR